MKAMQCSGRDGFTLIELSIVLVIIGLIIGGVLVGQDLIQASYIRSTIGQIEKYNSALNTFQSKFNGLPGDMTSTQATQFGMTARTGSPGDGDGNGILEGCSPSATGPISRFGCETALFWVDLSSANLTDTSFTTATDGLHGVTTLKLYMPSPRFGNRSWITVLSDSGLNYYEISTFNFISNAGIYVYNFSYYSLTPLQALSIDNKIDDGAALTGQVTALDNQYIDCPASPGATSCVYIDSTYNNSSPTLATSLLCNLRIRMN